MLTIIVLFVLILSVLVFVHELGHFVVARRNGMRVDEFGFGFPPRAFGVTKNAKTGKWEFVWGDKVEKRENTIYSVNWIPLGGFVKIKGEDGSERDDEDSFAAKSAWARIKVLSAGVAMNFLLAWVVFSFIFATGAPVSVEDTATNLKDPAIKITNVIPGTPAEEMGIQIGDEIIYLKSSEGELIEVVGVGQVQEFISSYKGSEVQMQVKRGNEGVRLSGTPRLEYPASEGSLGIELVRTAIVSYPIHEAIWQGLTGTVSLTWTILKAFGSIIASPFTGSGAAADVAGPLGIAKITGQVADLGLVYVLQFTALLSINLGIINILPIPALDGGRIMFVLLEVIKGSPVSKRFEQKTHAIGFSLLMLLMLVVTLKDFVDIGIVDMITNLF